MVLVRIEAPRDEESLAGLQVGEGLADSPPQLTVGAVALSVEMRRIAAFLAHFLGGLRRHPGVGPGPGQPGLILASVRAGENHGAVFLDVLQRKFRLQPLMVIAVVFVVPILVLARMAALV